MTRPSRRDFLRAGGASALVAGLAACTAPPPSAPTLAPVAPTAVASEIVPTAPTALPVPSSTAVSPAADKVSLPARRSLVVIQLSGGDDGLNMVIPYGDGLYYQLRPQIGIPAAQVLPLNDRIGLHPNLKGFKTLWDSGQLAVIQGVGYPNPSRSHFRSMEIWHTAKPEGSADQGWLGSFMDQVYRAGETPFQCVNLGTSVPKAVWTPNSPIAAIQDTATFHFLTDRKLPAGKDPLLKTFGQMAARPARKLPALQLVADGWDAAARGVDVLVKATEKYQAATPYPTSPFGKTLQQVAQLLSADLGTRVFYVSLGGFDTHANEKSAHAALMTTLADGLTAFQQDLERLGRADEVLVLGFSEFGRRVRENGSAGTDHGAAGPMFALGRGAKGGLYGNPPSLSELDDGDLRYNVDFRQVYSTILDDWMGVSPRSVLGGSFDKLGFVA